MHICVKMKKYISINRNYNVILLKIWNNGFDMHKFGISTTFENVNENIMGKFLNDKSC